MSISYMEKVKKESPFKGILSIIIFV